MQGIRNVDHGTVMYTRNLSDECRLKEFLNIKFGRVISFKEQRNHINAFAMGLFKIIKLESSAKYKKLLIMNLLKGNTFCNFYTNIISREIQLDNFEWLKDKVWELFCLSVERIEMMELNTKNLGRFGYNDIVDYEFFCENTFSIKILSHLFGVSSVIYKENTNQAKNFKIQVILPDLQNYRPTLYFYAQFTEYETYIVHTIIPREDIEEHRYMKNIIKNKNNVKLNNKFIDSKALLSYLASTQNLYNKVLRNCFNLNSHSRTKDFQLLKDLSFIKANKKTNNIDLMIKKISGEEIKPKILKYGKLDLYSICSYCLEMDNKNSKVFSLDCSCFFHISCLENYTRDLIEITNDKNSLKCYCGKNLNMELILSLLESENNKKIKEKYFLKYFGLKLCDICGMDSSLSINHSEYCVKSLCESCMVKYNNGSYFCSECNQPFYFNSQLEDMSFFCNGCKKIKSFYDMFITHDEYHRIGCYKCYVLGKFNYLPESLRELINSLKIECLSENNCKSLIKRNKPFVQLNGIEPFYHPSKKSCPDCIKICFFCIEHFKANCNYCGSVIEVIPDLLVLLG